MAAARCRAGAATLTVPTPRDRVVMSWSGGKDSCMALHELLRAGDYEVAGLLTTVSEKDGRVAMHGVSRELIERQAAAFGMPLTIVEVPEGASNAVYERALTKALLPMIADGLHAIAFGDLFLADIRAYREQLTARLGLEPVFPVWGRDTRSFTDEFIALGFKAIVVAVDAERLDHAFAGRPIDPCFVADLPSGVDRCGENGEYHSYVLDGPGFRMAIEIVLSARHLDRGIFYQGILLA